MQRIFSVKKKRAVAACSAFAAVSLKQSFSFQLFEQLFVDIFVRVHLNLGSGVLLSDHFQNDPARRRGAHGSLIEDQTLRSFFFELARVCGAAIGTVGAPNNFR